MEDPNVESHPNGAVVMTAEKLLKVPQVQANGKSNEKTTDDATPANGGANNVKPTADVVVPPDGGWGWVVVLASFICCLVVDGIVMTAGLFKDQMAKEFGASTAEVSFTTRTFSFLHNVCIDCYVF